MTPVPGQLQPLEVGNYWNYELRNFNNEVIDSSRYEILNEVRHRNYLDDLRRFAGTWISPSGPDSNRRAVYLNQSDGLHLVGLINGSDTAAVNFMVYPFPADSGTVFYSYDQKRIDGTDQFEATDSTRYELVSTDTRVDTPAGAFETYAYRRFEPPPFDVRWGDYTYFHFAPGIGLVGRFTWPENRDRIGAPNYALRLTGYSLCR